MKTALVTGGSSGIGRCTAAALRNAGFAVYEFSRPAVSNSSRSAAKICTGYPAAKPAVRQMAAQ